MQERESFWVKGANILVRFVILAIAVLFLFNIGRSVWKNHDVEKNISDLKSSINDLGNQSVNLRNRILYYQTKTYKELEARKHLYYQKPGEKVVILLKSSDGTNTQSSSNTTTKNDPDNPSNPDIPNWQKWINYIFG